MGASTMQKNNIVTQIIDANKNDIAVFAEANKLPIEEVENFIEKLFEEEKHTRSYTTSVRFTVAEALILKQRADNENKTLAEYIRMKALTE